MTLNVYTSYIESRILSDVSTILHGFSCKASGDMRKKEVVTQFQKELCIPGVFFQPKQVHGDSIIINPVSGTHIEADGVLVLRKNSPVSCIGVLTADCVPILFTDTEGSYIAAVHSGWKGTHKNIVRTMMQHIIHAGIQIDSVRVAIGPHIGPCCYTIPFDRIALFSKQYNTISEFAYQIDTEWHLDLGRLILKQLEQFGLRQHQIDTGVFCTRCQKDTFYSYRRDTKESFGEMIAMIGFR